MIRDFTLHSQEGNNIIGKSLFYLLDESIDLPTKKPISLQRSESLIGGISEEILTALFPKIVASFKGIVATCLQELSRMEGTSLSNV